MGYKPTLCTPTTGSPSFFCPKEACPSCQSQKQQLLKDGKCVLVNVASLTPTTERVLEKLKQDKKLDTFIGKK